MSRPALKSVATCPLCQHVGLTLKTKRTTHTTDNEDYVLHYSECPVCGTRCRTETTSVVIKRGEIPESESEQMPLI